MYLFTLSLPQAPKPACTQSCTIFTWSWFLVSSCPDYAIKLQHCPLVSVLSWCGVCLCLSLHAATTSEGVANPLSSQSPVRPKPKSTTRSPPLHLYLHSAPAPTLSSHPRLPSQPPYAALWATVSFHISFGCPREHPCTSRSSGGFRRGVHIQLSPGFPGAGVLKPLSRCLRQDAGPTLRPCLPAVPSLSHLPPLGLGRITLGCNRIYQLAGVKNISF